MRFLIDTLRIINYWKEGYGWLGFRGLDEDGKLKPRLVYSLFGYTET